MAEYQQSKRARFDCWPGMGILSGVRWGWSELGADSINTVVARIERHRARSLHGLYRLNHAELIRRVLVSYCDRPVATGCEGETGFGVKTVCVDSRSNRRRCNDLSGGVVPELHQTIVAANDEQRVFRVNRLPGRISARGQRPTARHPQCFGVDFAELTLVLDVYVDVAFPVRLGGFRLAFERYIPKRHPLDGINCRSVVSFSAVECEYAFRNGLVQDVIRVASGNFYLSDHLQRLRVEDRYRAAASIAGESTVQIPCQCDSMRLVAFADSHLPNDVAIRIEHHHIRSPGDENSVRPRVGGKVIPAAIAAQEHLLDQMILPGRGILRAACRRNSKDRGHQNCEHTIGEPR